MKSEIRVLGIDDASHTREDSSVLLIGVFFRGGHFMDGVITTKVERDGEDATIKIIEMVNKSKFRSQLQAILLDGIAFGGFNVVNIQSIAKYTKIPVITVIRKFPDFNKIKAALKQISMEKKYTLMELAGTPQKLTTKKGIIYIQHAGCTLSEAKEIITTTSTYSAIPEPIRVAHLIGQGITMGESKGRA